MHDRRPPGQRGGGHGQGAVPLVGVQVRRGRAEPLPDEQRVAGRPLAAVVLRVGDLGDVRADEVLGGAEAVGRQQDGAGRHALLAVGRLDHRGLHALGADHHVDQPGRSQHVDEVGAAHLAHEVAEHRAARAPGHGVAPQLRVARVGEVGDQRQRHVDPVGEPLHQRCAHLGQGACQPLVRLPVRLGHDVGHVGLRGVLDAGLALPAAAGSGHHRRRHRGVVAHREALVALHHQHGQAVGGRPQGRDQPTAGTGHDEVGPLRLGHRAHLPVERQQAQRGRGGVDHARPPGDRRDVHRGAGVDHRLAVRAGDGLLDPCGPGRVVRDVLQRQVHHHGGLRAPRRTTRSRRSSSSAMARLRATAPVRSPRPARWCAVSRAIPCTGRAYDDPWSTTGSSTQSERKASKPSGSAAAKRACNAALGRSHVVGGLEGARHLGAGAQVLQVHRQPGRGQPVVPRLPPTQLVVVDRDRGDRQDAHGCPLRERQSG